MATKFSKEELVKAFIQQGGIEDSVIEYYDIMIIGRTGMGKSTTSDKLIIANLTNRDYRGEAYVEKIVERGLMKMSDLSMWLVSDADWEKGQVTKRLKNLIFFRRLENPHEAVNTFHCDMMQSEPTFTCISNETTKVRILDVPGSVSTSASLSVTIMREILRIQASIRMNFKRILYFIPQRGALNRESHMVQMDFQIMTHYFGTSIFDCMVLIATLPPEVYENVPPGTIIPFSQNNIIRTQKHFQNSINTILPQDEHFPDYKPPVVFISMNDTCEDIFTKVKTAPIIFDGIRLNYKHGECIHCGLKTKFLKVGAEVVNIACYTVDPSCCIPYEESLCHPLMIQKFWGVSKLYIFGGIYRTLTGKSYRPGETCIHCRKIPGESGCMKVGTYYYNTVKNERLLVDHKLRIDDENSTFIYKIGAHISFLQKEILKCDYNGFQYSMKSYGITLEVPRGSVAIGKEIHMEIGVTLCGPFSFLRGTRPISPIVSLHLLGENTITEPFQLHVTLRHILGELTELKARHHRVQFCCNDYVSSDPGTYNFHLNDFGFISQSFTGNYGRVIMKKFCLLCMTAADTPEVQSEIGYCLTRVVCASELKNEAYLCLSYDAYLQAMKRQFPEEDGYTFNTSNRITFTKFSARLQFIPKGNDNCTLTMDQAAIRVSDVDILKRMSEATFDAFAYPPRVKINVNLKDNIDVVRVQINVRGSSNNEELRTDLSFPFKDAEELRHINAVQNAMESKGILDHTIVHGVFIGLARSGKDSLMKRLLRKKLSTKSPSTGVAENTVQVKVMKKSTTVAANIEESYWTEMDYDDEAIKLMSISIHNKIVSPEPLKQLPTRYQEWVLIEASVTMPVHSVESASLSTSSADGGDNHNTSSKARGRSLRAPIVQAPQFSSKTIQQQFFSVPNPTDILKGALRSKGLQALKQHFQKTWSLYLTNTGGQMEFQEVLPLLVSGPSVFFFTFRLDRDLNEHYSVEYELATGGRSYPYTTTCTTLEGILQTLASISAMGTFVYRDLQKRKAPLRPKVFFIGTHKDKLDPALVARKIASIDRQLKEIIESTSHCKELVEYASPSQLMFTVNNLSESDSDFQNIRSAVERVVMRGEFQMSSPAHWLIFSLALRKLDFHVVNYDHCFDIAKLCGITSQKEFDEALHFIHSKMGMIRYFPCENIKNLVIIDPQFLFDKVTELIVDTFTFEKAGKSKMDEFKHKGIFSMDEFELINAENQLEITTSQLGDLLVHLRIAAPFQINGEKKLFLPCVLAHAKISIKASQLSSPVSSLLIVFDCGYVPKGVPGALIKYLMTNEMKSPSEWVLLTDEIFRDKISFNIGPYDVIVLKIFPTHFEINCIPDEKFMVDRASPIEDTCDEILKAINVGIRQILKDLNYINCQHRITIQCQDSNCKFKHKTQVCMDKNGRSGTVCCQITKNRFNFPSNSHFWGFGKKPNYQKLGTDNVATQPSNTSQHTQIASMQPHQATSCDIHPSIELQSATLPERFTDTPRASSGTENQIPLGEEHHLVIFEQLQKHSCDWKEIGRWLGFLPSELEYIQHRPLLLSRAPHSWLDAVLEEWLQWAPEDSRRSKSFATLKNLKSALSNAGFEETAHTVCTSS